MIHCFYTDFGQIIPNQLVYLFCVRSACILLWAHLMFAENEKLANATFLSTERKFITVCICNWIASLIMIIREKRAFYGWCFRFTELFVDELDDPGDLRLLVKTYLQSLSGAPINGIVDFYQNIRHRASKSLADGTGRRPHFRLFCSFSDCFLWVCALQVESWIRGSLVLADISPDLILCFSTFNSCVTC